MPRSKSRNPPALPSNITRQQLTFVEVKPGIPLRMSYPLTAAATAYAIDVVTGADADHVRSNSQHPSARVPGGADACGWQVSIRANGGAPIQVGALKKGVRHRIALGKHGPGPLLLEWSTPPKGVSSLYDLSTDLMVAEAWLNPL